MAMLPANSFEVKGLRGQSAKNAEPNRVRCLSPLATPLYWPQKLKIVTSVPAYGPVIVPRAEP